jgi:hypothetical protein
MHTVKPKVVLCALLTAYSSIGVALLMQKLDKEAKEAKEA